MANNFTYNPLVVNTDMGTTTYKQTAGVNSNSLHLVVSKILVTLPTGSTWGVGDITITDGRTSPNTLLVIPITTSTQLPFNMDMTFPLRWNDMLVNGITAVGVELQIWLQ